MIMNNCGKTLLSMFAALMLQTSYANEVTVNFMGVITELRSHYESDIKPGDTFNASYTFNTDNIESEDINGNIDKTHLKEISINFSDDLDWHHVTKNNFDSAVYSTDNNYYWYPDEFDSDGRYINVSAGNLEDGALLHNNRHKVIVIEAQLARSVHTLDFKRGVLALFYVNEEGEYRHDTYKFDIVNNNSIKESNEYTDGMWYCLNNIEQCEQFFQTDDAPEFGIIYDDFESGQIVDWYRQGGDIEILNIGNESQNSLASLNRHNSMHGLAKDIKGKVESGVTYIFEADVMITGPSAYWLLVELKTREGIMHDTTRITKQAVYKNKWNHVYAEFTMPNIDFADQVLLKFFGPLPESDFALDNVQLRVKE